MVVGFLAGTQTVHGHCCVPVGNFTCPRLICLEHLLLLLLLFLLPLLPLQPQGLLKAEGGLQPSLLIDSSTILPTYTQKLANTIATYSLLAPGARKVPGSESPVFVDAPVSGGVPGAVAASLTFMVSCLPPQEVGCHWGYGRAGMFAREVPGSESPVFVDVPVSGGVPGAVAASLTFMVSCLPCRRMGCRQGWQ